MKLTKAIHSLFLGIFLFLGIPFAASAQQESNALVTNKLKALLTGKYDNTWDYSDGMIAVQNENGWGFCDETGKEVIKPQYESPTTFVNGYAAVKNKEGRTGLIDKTGKVQIPFDYDYIGDYENELVVARVLQGETGKYGFLDIHNNVVIPFQYTDVNVKWFADEIACVAKGDKWGAIDKSNKIVIPFEYYLLLGFEEGICVAMKKTDKPMLIDKSNKAIIPANKYDDILICSSELLIVEKKDKKGAVNKTGKEIIPLKYDNISCANHGFVSVTEGEESYLLDLEGNTLFKGQNFFNLEILEENTLIANIADDPLYYLIDKEGNKKTEKGYTTMLLLGDNFILVYDEAKAEKYYINFNGEKVGDYHE